MGTTYEILMENAYNGEPFSADGARQLHDLAVDAYECVACYGSDVDGAVYGRAVRAVENYCGFYGIDPAPYLLTEQEMAAIEREFAT